MKLYRHFFHTQVWCAAWTQCQLCHHKLKSCAWTTENNSFNAVIKIYITYSRHISILHKQWLKDTEHPKKQWKKSVVSVKKHDFTPFNVHGSVHRKNILIYIQQDAMLHSIFYLETALHVLGGTSTHHQEHKQLCLQHLVFVTPLLLPAAIMEELELVWVCSQHSTAQIWLFALLMMGEGTTQNM